MPRVIKDERKWRIDLEFSNEDCPHLFYPRNIYGCKILSDREHDSVRCTLEACPHRIKASIKLPTGRTLRHFADEKARERAKGE